LSLNENGLEANPSKGAKSISPYLFTHMHISTHIYAHIYTYIYMFLCVCMFVYKRGR